MYIYCIFYICILEGEWQGGRGGVQVGASHTTSPTCTAAQIQKYKHVKSTKIQKYKNTNIPNKKVQKYKHKMDKYDSHTTSLSCCTSTQQCKYKNMQSKQIHKICVCVSINRSCLTYSRKVHNIWLEKLQFIKVQLESCAVQWSSTESYCSYCIILYCSLSVFLGGQTWSIFVTPGQPQRVAQPYDLSVIGIWITL